MWVLVAIAWGFGAAIVITVLPLTESSEDIEIILTNMWLAATGKPMVKKTPEEMAGIKPPKEKEISDSDKEVPSKEVSANGSEDEA